jgi:hypothetical protein
MAAPFTVLSQVLRPFTNLIAGRPVLATFQVNLRCNFACGYCDLPLNVGWYERRSARKVFSFNVEAPMVAAFTIVCLAKGRTGHHTGAEPDFSPPPLRARASPDDRVVMPRMRKLLTETAMVCEAFILEPPYKMNARVIPTPMPLSSLNNASQEPKKAWSESAET